MGHVSGIANFVARRNLSGINVMTRNPTTGGGVNCLVVEPFATESEAREVLFQISSATGKACHASQRGWQNIIKRIDGFCPH